MRILLSQGLFTLIDDIDLWINQWKWSAFKSPHSSVYYAVRRVFDPLVGKRVPLLLHRVVMSADAGVEVDHIDGDGLNNQRSNLRLATHSQNQSNRHRQKNNTSGFVGVCFASHAKRWKAQLRHENRNLNLGYFDTPEEAALVYDKAAKVLFGEFANLNFPATRIS